jgi:hypothetical protein
VINVNFDGGPGGLHSKTYIISAEGSIEEKDNLTDFSCDHSRSGLLLLPLETKAGSP